MSQAVRVVKKGWGTKKKAGRGYWWVKVAPTSIHMQIRQRASTNPWEDKSYPSPFLPAAPLLSRGCPGIQSEDLKEVSRKLKEKGKKLNCEWNTGTPWFNKNESVYIKHNDYMKHNAHRWKRPKQTASNMLRNDSDSICGLMLPLNTS